MRLVAWNCAMALDRKLDALMALRPDVAVISEVARPERLLTKVPALADASLVWIGNKPNKGLLVVGFGGVTVEMSRHRYDARLHWMAPVSVSGLPGLDEPLRLLGVWAQNANEGNRKKANQGICRTRSSVTGGS